MDWFEKLTGFQECNYGTTRANLAVHGNRLNSLVNGKSYIVGKLEMVSLAELRQRAASAEGPSGRLKVSPLLGDVRALHRGAQYADALFQVASQFNLLEMTGPNITPEDGVTIYQYDRTQGPACAIAAGAATIYRNYFAQIGTTFGQTKDRQIDGSVDIGVALSKVLDRPVETLWTMKNGYAQCSLSGLNAIADYISFASVDDVDRLRGKLRVGLHSDVEVTDVRTAQLAPTLVSQIFCSALPVSYNPQIAPTHWQALASLILEAAYEATIWAAVLNARRGASDIVLLTSLGGGAFGNDTVWIEAALRRALNIAKGFALDVRLVSFGASPREFTRILQTFAP